MCLRGTSGSTEFSPICILRCQIKETRTEIQGVQGAPLKIFSSCFSKSLLLYWYFRISDRYSISYVYLVQFLPFTSPLAVCTKNQTCPTQEPCVHPKIDLTAKSICIEEQKLALF